MREVTEPKSRIRLGRLPLTIGMPVMITQNFDVENGIVNGATGIVKQIRYTDMTGPPLPNLPPKHAAILIKRTQIPIVPGFAMTAHKAQGKTHM
ncbi:hypothetical protein C8R44DRAFT_778727 [Mycena epipterygia]|nr:hypothetical protein C8R44DRAFT_778727 [Mycena epipterygia]